MYQPYYELHQMVMAQPMLENGEEESLWEEYFDPKTSDLRKDRIKERMIASHMRFALARAKKWSGYKVPLEDIFGEAVEGLVEAFNRFEPDRDVKFSTYASWWVNARIGNFVIGNNSMIKSGTSAIAKHLFFKYNAILAKVLKENPHLKPNEHQTDLKIAEKISQTNAFRNMSEEEILKHIDTYRESQRHIASLDAKLLRDEDEGGSLIDFIPDREELRPDIIVEEADNADAKRAFLSAAANHFSKTPKLKREWEIISARKLTDDPCTLQDLSEELGISRERVRQIELSAIKELERFGKEYLSNQRHKHRTALQTHRSQPRALPSS
jgi:RNA polymerase sigma-32 factor